jgi:hypothetical protein
VLPVVADHLLSSRFPIIRTEACRLVTNVASEGARHVQAVVDCTQLVAALGAALAETAPVEVRAAAAKAVGAAAASGSPEQIGLLVHAGFPGPMCDMLLKNDHDVDNETTLYILEGLEMMLYVGEAESRSKGGGGGGNGISAKLVEAEGVSSLRTLRRRSSNECSSCQVQEKVAAILKTYFETEKAVV